MTVTNIESRLRDQMAFSFVNVYEQGGELAAAMWADEHIPEKHHDFMAPHIREEFIRRGWVFNDDSVPEPPEPMAG